MKVLLSAFAFAPNVGSEPGVGWRWALELARDHEVTVITDISRKSSVENCGQSLPTNLRIIYHRPRLVRNVRLGDKTAQLLYLAWQFTLLSVAKRLHVQERFDLAFHCTYGVFRHPYFLGMLRIPFVFGPLGGGEDAPWALKKSIRGSEKVKEVARFLANRAVLMDPFLWWAYSKSSLILTKTEETRGAIPRWFRHKTLVYPEIGIDPPSDVRVPRRDIGESLKLLYAGRLLGLKGIHLGIRAVKEANRRGCNVEFYIVGKGAYEHDLRTLAETESAGHLLHWMPPMPQEELFRRYSEMHGLLFPSLHDSSGNVVLEAQAFGLPVICLDLGGPATLVTHESAIVVSTRAASEEDVVHSLASAICKLSEDESLRYAMGVLAVERTRNLHTWRQRISGAIDLASTLAPRND